MIIGMLLNAPYPSDVRIKKETDALLRAGHSIHLLCLRRAGETVTQQAEGITITRIDAGKNNLTLAFWDVLMSSWMIHPKFRYHMRNWIRQYGIQALHVHDLPLVGTALSVKKEFQIPVIADFHENYPDAMKVWFEWKTNPVARLKNKLFMNYQRWKKIEEHAVVSSDYVIAVVDEMRDRLMEEYHPDENKIVVVTNSEEQSFLHQPDEPDIYQAWHDKFKLVYTGNIGPHRGVDTLIESLRYLPALEDIVVIIVGSGSDAVMHTLRQRAKALRVDHRVFFLGRQPFSRFFAFMHRADVNVIPHKSNTHTDHTIPHKLFQGMMAGKPMLVSSSAPLKRIITQAGAGLVFEAGNAEALARQVMALYNHPELCRTLGEHGYQSTVQGNMNWEHDQQYLLRLYQQLN